ncbi:hypothetical protein [Lysobacter sp. Root604]|uniref:hypothetical protein n=1 Tax=Lysobacter sp. Root604 TaxID=1736568 RepID=UPI0009E84347|nr:hypothetical protein [Lysobacter sp. Root604]
MSKSIVVYGPMASGKTLNATALCKAYGLRRVVELDDRPLDGKRQLSAEGVLMLTCSHSLAEETARRLGVKLVSIAEARQRAGSTWRAPR